MSTAEYALARCVRCGRRFAARRAARQLTARVIETAAVVLVTALVVGAATLWLNHLYVAPRW